MGPVILDLGYGPGEYRLGCPGAPWYIGRGPEGQVALYSPAGAELVRYASCEDYRAARRAVRACRRAMGHGPMRLRVTIAHEGFGDREISDACEVYGWRAALVAVRAMRAEMCPDGTETPRRRARYAPAFISDAKLDAVLWPDD